MADPGLLVELNKVERHFESPVETIRAVDGIDFSGSSGEFVCLFGHSGSGKTTILNLIAGLDRPTAGMVAVVGFDLQKASAEARIRLRRETVGMVHQSDVLIEEFTAAENVALPMEATGVDTGVAIDEAGRLLALVGLDSHSHRLPSQLSGGQRQRVGIARALSGGRKILLADEPTGSLDSRSAGAIFDLLAELARNGTLVIVASHDPACRDRADRSLEILDGQIVN